MNASKYLNFKLLTLVTFLLFSFIVSGQITTQTLNYTGNIESFIVPAGVTEITVEVWGAGGAGGAGEGTGKGNKTPYGGAGGAGGAYVSYQFTVIDGEGFNYYVGSGGVGHKQHGGTDGQGSWFSDISIVSAEGGVGGVESNGGIVSGGEGSISSSVGNNKTPGVNGGEGSENKGGAGGQGANNGGIGGVEVTSENIGNNGSIPGGGGSGGFGKNNEGGTGGNGQIRITYTICIDTDTPEGTVIPPTCDVATGSIVLSGLPAGDWVLTQNDGSSTIVYSGNGSTRTISELDPGTYNFQVEDISNSKCISDVTPFYDIIAKEVSNTPNIEIVTQPTCDLSTGSIELSGLPSGNWELTQNGVLFSNGSGSNYTVNNLAPGTYNFQVEDTDTPKCLSAFTSDVEIIAKEISDSPTIGTITQPNCIVTTGSAELSGLPMNGWLLTQNDGSSLTTISGSGTEITISDLVSGTYNYSVKGLKNGLYTEYFNNIDLSGTPALTRTDNEVNYDWGGGSPDVIINSDVFSVRWTGFVEADYSETYAFSTQSDDGIRLWVNGVQVINNWTNHSEETDIGAIDLVAGEKYEIVLEYYENSGDAVAKLSWQSPSQAIELIPTTSLFSFEECESDTSIDVVIDAVPSGPAHPGAISGDINPAIGSSQIYAVVTPISGITYTWEVPVDWTIISGQGTDVIEVIVDVTSGDIKVTPSTNFCGDGTPATLEVTPSVDTDADGYSDIVDLDDDNDGILDTVEDNCSVTGFEGYWSFENSTDDQSGNGNNRVGIEGSGLLAYNNAGLDGSVAVDFTGDYLLQYSDGNFMNNAIRYFSYSFWIYPESLTGTQYLLDEGGETNGVSIRLDEDVLEFMVSELDSRPTIDTSSFPALSINTWYHIALVYENGDVTVFLNGVAAPTLNTGFGELESHSNEGGFGGTNSSNSFGEHSDGFYFNGLMDEVHYFEKAISPSEIGILNNLTCDSDFDNDGIINSLDTDSDNDGCPDAMEGGITVDYSDLDVDDRIAGNVDSNGIPELVGVSGQGDVSSKNDSVFGNCVGDDMDFDGNTDYIETTLELVGLKELTMMAWIKLDELPSSSNNAMVIMGESPTIFMIDSQDRLDAEINVDNNNPDIHTTNKPFVLNQWYHVAAVYNSDNTVLDLYINGELQTSVDRDDMDNTIVLQDTSSEFEIGRNDGGDDDHFNGAIREAKVFSKALNANEIQEQVYQQIENIGGQIFGSEVPKQIGALEWDDLELYLALEESPFGGIIRPYNFKTIDITYSGMDSSQETNAPLPYVADSIGVWTNIDTWQHGDVWDIEDIGTPRPWSIIKMEKSSWIPAADTLSLTIDQSMQLFGLKLMDKTKFIVNGSIDITTGAGVDLASAGDSLYVSDYLLLDGGILDLEGESQLFQDSDALNEALNGGFMERDQQGTKDKFTYNYWSSPVNTKADDITYALNEILPNSEFGFTSGLNGSIVGGKIMLAEYWIWTYKNGTGAYSEWIPTRSSGRIKAGEGYTMKGPSSGVEKFQNYIFQGIPNNGDISLNITKGNEYLVGNPYPSALNANTFIDDNEDVLKDVVTGEGGTLLFWEHWGGGSHNLKAYEGGYAYYTKSGGIEAVGYWDKDDDGSKKEPGKFIPVGQGFFVKAPDGIADNSKIVFNNAQREFRTEVNIEESIFMKPNKDHNKSFEATGDKRMKIRLGVDMPKGFHRQLLITEDSHSTSDVDYGFEAKLADDFHNDMFWVLDENKYIIQAIPEINKNTEIPLGFKMKSAGKMTVRIDQLENAPENLNVYIKELASGETFEISEAIDFEIELEKGTHNDKYALVFHPELKSENELILKEGLSSYLDNVGSEIHISKLINTTILGVNLYNMAGQLIHQWDSNLEGNELIMPINLNTGVYLLQVETTMGVYSRKLLKN